MNEDYRTNAEPATSRIERLEEAVSKFKFQRFYEAIRWGIQGLLILGGASLALFGGSYWLRACAYESEISSRAEIETERAQDELRRARRDEVSADEMARNRARQECVDACEAAGMRVGYARVVEDGEFWRTAACSCVNERGRRALWNDLRSRRDALTDQCAAACEEAGMGLSRAVVRKVGRPREDDRTTYELESVACACVDETSHRTLWDDRQGMCQLYEEDGDTRCEVRRP